ncbi:bpX6 domain-containing protein [Kitasatospora sp. NPDC096128]|uniref:bpX6 domain-containing protein n=1 Tax=Kitasatospora sp. NPDC096128 TaxID=3155547 RepID=UPI003322F8B7
MVDAAGFLLDVPLLGTAEASERALAHWQDGAQLAELPDGRWLLRLPEPERTRADRAPGAPLHSVGGALVAGPGQAGAAGELVLTAGGLTERHVIAELRAVQPADWLDLSGLTLHRLGPVGTPVDTEPVETDLPSPAAVDLRAAAGIPGRSRRAGRLLGEQPGRGDAGVRPSRELLAVGALVLLVLYLPLVCLEGFSRVTAVLPAAVGLSVGPAFLLPHARARVDRRMRRTAARAGRVRPPVGAAAGPAAGRSVGRREWWTFLLCSLVCLLVGVTGLAVDGLDGRGWLLTLLGTCGGALAVLPRIPFLADRIRAAQEGRARTAGKAGRGATGSAGSGSDSGTGSGTGGGTGSGSGTGGGTGSRSGGVAGSGSARRRPPRRPHAQWLARLALRSPAAPFLRQRHTRYLQQLSRSFRQRRWEDALRDAVRLSGGADGRPGQGLLTLRLPDRFAGALRPSPQDRGGQPTALPLSGPSVHDYLTGLYREAAEALERDRRIDEAAYVLADLLAAPAEAVALLDRHGRTAQAAELAEGRGLAAELVVRLHWRAGNRERAVRIAHRRGAFATAVERLTATDPAAARELRAAWVDHRRRAGDRLGAVEAAWPDETLRAGVLPDLREAAELGGAARGRALVHLLALGEDAVQPVRAVLDAAEPTAAEPTAAEPTAAERAAAVAALAELRCADPAVDRELATLAVRSLVRTGGLSGHPGVRSESAVHTRLLKRADPLAAADLPKPRRTGPSRSGALTVTAADRPGTLPVLDAARLDSGLLLVAGGHAGVRLLGPDGRTRVRWDVPAEQLVVADHGGTALLVARYGTVRELFRLDLATRRVERWTALRVRGIASSYDGRHLLTVDEDGLTVLDTRAARPTVVHRELGGDQRALGRIARTPAGCAVVVHTRAGGHTAELTELWRWDQPGWELRARTAVDLDDADDRVTLADGRLLVARPGEVPGTNLLSWTGRVSAERTVTGPPVVLSADGAHWAFTERSEDGLRTTVGGASGAAFTAVLPGATTDPSVRLRAHAGAVTCWHRTGRVFAVRTDGTELLANLRVTAG